MGGAMDTPLERPGRTVEVEGRLGEEEVSMTEWCQVRRKRGQVETDVAAGSRGWEEYQRKFPHLAFIQRYVSKGEWSERKVVKEWLAGGDESRLMEREEEKARLVGLGVLCWVSLVELDELDLV